MRLVWASVSHTPSRTSNGCPDAWGVTLRVASPWRLHPSRPRSNFWETRRSRCYPAINHIEHNEWLYRKATWSEIQVVNRKTGLEIWIPRRYVGELSSTGEPVLILGLTRELEYTGGMVCPCRRRIIQMPAAPGAPLAGGGTDHVEPAPILGIRLESSTDRRMFHLVAVAVAVAIFGYLVAASFTRVGAFRQRIVFTAKDQSFLELTPRDDYLAVVTKLGKPAQDRLQEIGTIQYRGLGYPNAATRSF